MHFGIEVRLPFLDYRLVELSARIGPEIKMKDGQTKYIPRASLRGLVPDPILDRHRKHPFPVPLERWLRKPRKLTDEVAQTCESIPFVVSAQVKKAITDYQRGDKNIPIAELWRMVSAVLWWNSFFARKPHRSYVETGTV
jgi:asparagine synthase (glutamine-hydrolysing)